MRGREGWWVGYFFHHGLEVFGFHGVSAAVAKVLVRVPRFHGCDVREDFMVAKHTDAGVEDLGGVSRGG